MKLPLQSQKAAPMDHSNTHPQEPVEAEPGLSSAMHDIRKLARSYQMERERSAPELPLELGGVSMTPNFILQPQATSRQDSWKAIALTMMVLLGLSTSALAMKLFSDEEAKSPTLPLQLQLDSSHLEAPVEAPSATVFPAEPTLYQTSSAPGSVLAPPELHVTTTPSLRVREAAARVSRKAVEEVDSCDEVACLIDSSDACCQAFASVRASEQPAADVYRPYRPTRSELMSPLKSIHGRVESCFDKYQFSGVATVHLVLSAKGAITSFALSEGSPEFQSCIEGYVRELKFPELSQSFRFSYPFIF